MQLKFVFAYIRREVNMKKKLLGTGLALAIALTCTAPLAACDFGGGDDKGAFSVTASSIEVKEVPLTVSVTGWELTDTQVIGERTLHCVDLYVYAESNAPDYTVEIKTDDFTATNGKPVSIHKVGDSYTFSGLELTSTENQYVKYANVQQYLTTQKPYLSANTKQSEGDYESGYTVTSGTSYYQYTAVDLARGRFQRYALEFEEENLSSAIQYKGQNIYGIGNSEMFPSNSYKFGSSNLQMFIDDNHSYEITYGITTKTYATEVDEELTLTDRVVEIKGLTTNRGSTGYVSDFSMKVGDTKYSPTGIFAKVSDGVAVPDNSFLREYDKFKDMDLTYVRCYEQNIELDTKVKNIQLSTTAIDLTLYFPELTEKPSSFKLYYGVNEIKIK